MSEGTQSGWGETPVGCSGIFEHLSLAFKTALF
jgi:hypothetical protein